MTGALYGDLVGALADVAARERLQADDIEYALFQYSTWNRRRVRLSKVRQRSDCPDGPDLAESCPLS